MKQTELSFLAPAKNQLASVLKKLIDNDFVSERDTNFTGFRGRISNLRLDHGLDIRFETRKFINPFGRKSYYRDHCLVDKEKAIEVYQKINK